MPDAYLKNLSKQTVGERFWLDRRRLGKTQAEVAERLDMSEKRYNQLENDKGEYEFAPPPGRTELGALCALARRRSGKSLRATAAIFGISHTELLNREREDDARLAKAWKALGYRFYPK